MKFKHILFLLFITLSLLSCSNNATSEGDEEEYTEEGYQDGTYCAEVDYYNPNTGTSNTYTLEVEVSDNEVTQINWSNGGWMDEDHFYSEALDSDGTCSFTSDKGYEYTVRILGQNCGSTDESSFQSDVDDDENAVTCPECGGEKSDYDDYCDDCTDKHEHTCKRCGQYDSFMFSMDDLCSDCQSSDEENE